MGMDAERPGAGASTVEASGGMQAGVLPPGIHRFHGPEETGLAVLAGRARVRVGMEGWQELVAGEGLRIPAGTDYEVEVDEAADRLVLGRPVPGG